MLHEIHPLGLNNAFVRLEPQTDDPVICYLGEHLLVADGEAVAFPARSLLHEEAQFHYLYAIGEQRYFLCCMDEKLELPGFHWQPVRALRYGMPLSQAYAGILGHHLYHWYATRRFCGRCGRATAPDTRERMILCEACGLKEYPVIMPAVIVGVIRGDSLLLTKYANRENPNWALVAGFCEVGETLEQAVAREVMEEAGLRVCNITYYKSQPWPFSGSLLAGFFAEAEGDDPVIMDAVELSAAAFVKRDEITVPFEGRALTNEMICFFRDHGPKAAIHRDPIRQSTYIPLA